MVGSQFLSFYVLLDLNLVFVNPYYVGAALIGGMIMGAGFVMGGFCPGTGISTLSFDKIDAFVFIIGGMVGAFLFAETYPFIESFAMKGFKGPLQYMGSYFQIPWSF